MNLSFNKLIEEANKYKLMAQYFQFVDPVKHQYYFEKHLHYYNKAFEMSPQTRIVRDKKINFRFVHASPSSPAVDVYVNDEKVFSNLRYKNISEYITLHTGTYKIDIYAAEQKEEP
ncbi:MAG: DUF4397 domain-containing protein, partial [Bacillaceae bacterium]|nr:DUF4397 domain-containing protein [Bacillaceae bacterium]